MEKTDYELIRAVGAGDHWAFEQLVKKYQNALFSFVCRYLGERPAAEDIVQEVFLSLYRTAFRFEARARVSTWLFRIAYNLSMNEIKRRERSLQCKGVFQDLLAAEASQSPLSSIEAREWQKDLMTALNQLPEKQKAALLLRVNEGLSYAEIGEVLSVSIASTESLIFRARTRLRQLLKGK